MGEDTELKSLTKLTIPNLIKHQAKSLVCRVAQWAGLFFTGIVTLDFVTWIGQEKMSRRVTKILVSDC